MKLLRNSAGWYRVPGIDTADTSSWVVVLSIGFDTGDEQLRYKAANREDGARCNVVAENRERDP